MVSTITESRIVTEVHQWRNGTLFSLFLPGLTIASYQYRCLNCLHHPNPKSITFHNSVHYLQMWISSRLSIWNATRLTQTHPSGIPQASIATKPNFITHIPLPPFYIPSVKALPPYTSQTPVVQDSRLMGIFEDCCTGHNAEFFCDPTESSRSLSYREGVWKLLLLIQTLHVLSTDLPATASPSATTLAHILRIFTWTIFRTCCLVFQLQGIPSTSPSTSILLTNATGVLEINDLLLQAQVQTPYHGTQDFRDLTTIIPLDSSANPPPIFMTWQTTVCD